jgi:hypothetical protein
MVSLGSLHLVESTIYSPLFGVKGKERDWNLGDRKGNTAKWAGHKIGKLGADSAAIKSNTKGPVVESASLDFNVLERGQDLADSRS